MGKKKFIDKKKSATFQLLARDSADPSYGDGPSGDRVFVRVDNNPYSVSALSDEHSDAVPGEGQLGCHGLDSVFADAPDDDEEEDDAQHFGERAQSLPQTSAAPLPDHIRREILELGFPDDGYNYLIHLRDIKNTGGGSTFFQNSKAKLDQLPRDVKAYDASRVDVSKVNDDSNDKSIYSVASRTVGVRLQKAVDPEVAALLDDSDLSRFGSDDDEDLEEDFVVKANLPNELVETDFDEKLSLVEKSVLNRTEIIQSKASDSQGNMPEFVGAERDRNYPRATSEYCTDEKPRVRRLLDEQFDLLEHQEYGTDSGNEYDDFIDEEDEHPESLAEKLNHALKDHVKEDIEIDGEYKVPSDLLHNKEKPGEDSADSVADVIHRCREYAEKYENGEENEEMAVILESSDESEGWDCETIISTYSNLDNHYGKIEAPELRRRKKLAETLSGALTAPGHVISLKGKEKLPVDYLPGYLRSGTGKVKDGNTMRKEHQKRKQHGQESKEEKKERKAAVKAERREARQVKKEMKGLYRCEAQRAQRVAASTGPSSVLHL
ncbi:uncharacterized protein LOC127807623 [Diospyros lotus]|uniref:uncharacterized protein LOC127807623 n=1 Tax=Diospyros lotus TaxID=55363 RepID=UPI002255C707|nr:uncharacterized protein LOC127807623 [Diospyros lotus]